MAEVWTKEEDFVDVPFRICSEVKLIINKQNIPI